jgi:hypothetical protein
MTELAAQAMNAIARPSLVASEFARTMQMQRADRRLIKLI